MNAKISVFIICVDAIIYLLLDKLHDCTFKEVTVTKLVDKFYVLCLLSEDLVKKVSANVNLKLSGAREVYLNKLSRTENKLSENSSCLDRTQKAISFPLQIFLFKNKTTKLAINNWNESFWFIYC